MTVRLIVVDDHAVVRVGLVMVLSMDDGLDVVGEAGDGLEALTLAADQAPDVAVLDLQMPNLDGVATTKRLADEHPDIGVLILTTYDTDHSIMAAVDAGASGYLLKDAPPEELIEAVKAVARGESVLPETISAKLAERRRKPKLEELSDREVEVLQCLARGLSNRATADELFVSVATVKTHLIHVYQKLQVSDRTSAVTKALEEGIISLGSD